MRSSDYIVLELAGETTSSGFGAGVNEALATESTHIVDIARHVSKLRTLAARDEATVSSSHEMEKYGVQAYTDGGDLGDGSDPTWSTINNQSLVQFLDSAALHISFGVKLSRKVVKQARADPEAFMQRYRKSLGEKLAEREDVYIGSVLVNSPTSDSVTQLFGGDATTVDTLEAGDVFTSQLVEDMIDEFKEQTTHDPSHLVLPSRLARQLRDDARKLNNAEYRTVIREDGLRVKMYGDIEVVEVGGSTILPFATNGSSVQYNSAVMMNKDAAFGVVQFAPVQFWVGEPDPTTAGNNYHRMLIEESLECKILDENALVVAKATRT